MNRLIAIVSGDRTYVEVLTDVLTDAGYQTTCCFDSQDAQELIYQQQPTLVILDLWLEHRDAGEMVLGLLQLDHATRHIPIIVCPEHTRCVERMLPLLEHAPCAVLVKPFAIEALLTNVQALMSHPLAQPGCSR